VPEPAGQEGLRAEGLVRRFGGVAAVDGVSIALAPGEIAAVIGPNGAGKSTLFDLLSGVAAPDAGRRHRSLIAGWVVKPSVQRLSGDGCPRRVMVLSAVGVSRRMMVSEAPAS
jgi:ABC-type sugar transport system ATPase subunit